MHTLNATNEPVQSLLQEHKTKLHSSKLVSWTSSNISSVLTFSSLLLLFLCISTKVSPQCCSGALIIREDWAIRPLIRVGCERGGRLQWWPTVESRFIYFLQPAAQSHAGLGPLHDECSRQWPTGAHCRHWWEDRLDWCNTEERGQQAGPAFNVGFEIELKKTCLFFFLTFLRN